MTNDATEGFTSLDPDLPTIAAKAAAEVDALIRNEKTQHHDLARLADVMTRAFGDDLQDVGTSRRSLDPVATGVLWRTLRDAQLPELTTYDALRTASLELARRLRETDSASNDNDLPLTDLKKFCLALSRHSLAILNPTDAFPVSNPYKR